MIFKTNEEAQARCRFWQEILRLQDWNVTVKVLRRSQKWTESTCGSVRVFLDSKSADLQLLDSQDFQPGDDPSIIDMEDTLVHELLHLHMESIVGAESLPKTDPKFIALEQAVNAMAGGFVRALRMGEPAAEAPPVVVQQTKSIALHAVPS